MKAITAIHLTCIFLILAGMQLHVSNGCSSVPGKWCKKNEDCCKGLLCVMDYNKYTDSIRRCTKI
uniref:Prokineticin domain-containing protein n=1 Tax=Strigamia maritima TaxID=126957 RepID=T1JGJ1_STRMM